MAHVVNVRVAAARQSLVPKSVVNCCLSAVSRIVRVCEGGVFVYTWLIRTIRAWGRAPLVALTIVTLAALGVAGPLVIFRPAYSLVLSPLRVHDPDRLVRLGGRIPVFNVYTRTFDRPERFSGVFENMAAYAPLSGISSYWRPPGAERPLPLRGLAVTPEFFAVLGSAPELGSTRLGRHPAGPVVVLSNRLWRDRLAADPAALGTTVEIGGTTHRVIGVMPAAFDFTTGVDAWVSLETSSFALAELEVIARLISGVSMAAATNAVETQQAGRAIGVAGQYVSVGPTLQPLHQYLVGDKRRTSHAVDCRRCVRGPRSSWHCVRVPDAHGTSTSARTDGTCHWRNLHPTGVPDAWSTCMSGVRRCVGRCVGQRSG